MCISKKHFSDENGTNGLVVTDWKKKKMPPVLFFLGIVFSKEERTNDADAIRQWIPSANV
jgi:hypothetical protein